MSHRKLKGDYLFTRSRLLDGVNVLIVETDSGEVIEIVPENESGENVEIYDGIICPGFVNAHCHLELSHLKGIISEHTGLVDFVLNIIALRNYSPDVILDSARKAEEEMRSNGIVAVGDICNNALTVSPKLKYCINYHNFIEVSGWVPQGASTRFNQARTVYDEFLKNELCASMVPHAPYSVCEGLWAELNSSFKNKVVTIHNQETIHEDSLFLRGEGDFIRMFEKMNIDISFYKAPSKRSLEVYFKNLFPTKSVILVHNTFTTAEDIEFINANKPAQQLVSFCLCPNANLYIENTMPPVKLLLENNCRIVLGTDSLASNRQLSILEEMKTIANHFPEIQLETMLGWATLNGAQALNMDTVLGSFDIGKTPGVTLINKIENGKITAESKAINLLNAGKIMHKQMS